MTDSPKLPPRNVLAEVSRQDQRMLKWFEDVSRAVGVADGAAADLAGLQDQIDDLDAGLAGKADLVHTHVPGDVTGLSEAIDDRVAALLVAGPNVTLTYDDVLNSLIIAATGGNTDDGGAFVIDDLTGDMVFDDNGDAV